jgi:hypothetical protein
MATGGEPFPGYCLFSRAIRLSLKGDIAAEGVWAAQLSSVTTISRR